jgi:hypothetical protein
MLTSRHEDIVMEVINYSHTQSKIYTTKTLMIDEMNIILPNQE